MLKQIYLHLANLVIKLKNFESTYFSNKYTKIYK
jgi:hypothetical protein